MDVGMEERQGSQVSDPAGWAEKYWYHPPGLGFGLGGRVLVSREACDDVD